MAEFLSRGVPAVGMLAPHNSRFAEAFRSDELAADLLRIEDGGSLAAESECIPEAAAARGRVQFGTLGGGNHFIELERVDRIFDEPLAAAWGLRPGQLVVMIHSGSRGLGHEVGGQFMKLALAQNEKCGDVLPSRQLMYLSLQSKEGRQYHEAMKCAANFAYANRQVMATLVRHNLRHTLGEIEMPLVYDVAHNIAKFEMVDGQRLCVHRKGATRAFPPSLMQGTPFAETGQPVLIPGSMGTASYLLSGVESGRRSLYSVNHGAGRTMSRTEAAGPRRRGKGRRGAPEREGAISDDDFRRAMDGVYLVCEDKSRIKEEAPQAYKDIEVVIDTVVGAGLANRVARFVPLAVLKG
jgi:tRNA-splicing ligase RtcB